MKGTKLEFLRTLKGYNQDYIAHKSNIEVSKYKRIEADISKASNEELQRIAEILGTNIDDLKNPNPYLIVNFNNSPNSLGNGNQYYETNQKVIDTIIDNNVKLTNTICQIVNDFSKTVAVFEKNFNLK